MKKSTKVLLFFLIAVLVSCSNRSDFETYIKHLGIEFSDSYKTDSILNFGFNDWMLEAHVRISENDKNRILKILTAKISFPIVKTKEEYFLKNFKKGDSINGFIMNSKYYYGISENMHAYISDKKNEVGYQTYELELDTITNKLIFNYKYE